MCIFWQISNIDKIEASRKTNSKNCLSDFILGVLAWPNIRENIPYFMTAKNNYKLVHEAHRFWHLQRDILYNWKPCEKTLQGLDPRDPAYHPGSHWTCIHGPPDQRPMPCCSYFLGPNIHTFPRRMVMDLDCPTPSQEPPFCIWVRGDPTQPRTPWTRVRIPICTAPYNSGGIPSTDTNPLHCVVFNPCTPEQCTSTYPLCWIV